MPGASKLYKHLRPGGVYRRAELAQWSNAVDRDVSKLVQSGALEKLSTGVYHLPKSSVFGKVPADDHSLVRTFLKDDEFLVTSPNAYNALGVGTTQLYNKRVVYNHKRHGEFHLGGRTYFFHMKHKFPKSLSEEFLLVDLVNNLDSLAEDKTEVLKKVLKKAYAMDTRKLKTAVAKYGGAKAKTFLKAAFEKSELEGHGN